MTFASSMQHKIYWGPLKKPLEWSLKTWMAPWSYIASILYHDFYWYPRNSKEAMMRCLDSPWGRLFANWEELAADARGFPDVGRFPAEFERSFFELMKTSGKVLWGSVAQAPEFTATPGKR